jgi:hypothetical protein
MKTDNGAILQTYGQVVNDGRAYRASSMASAAILG